MVDYKIDQFGDLVVFDTENKISVTVENTIRDFFRARRAIWLINNHILKSSRDLIEYLDNE